MKLHVLSDIHNEFSTFDCPQTDADIIVLAGDIDIGLKAIPWAKALEKPVIYVFGNHEFYGQTFENVREDFHEAVQGTNIHLLDDDELILNGVRFLGGTLWTDFELFGPEKRDEVIDTAQMYLNDFRLIRLRDGGMLTAFGTIEHHQKTLTFLRQKLTEPFDGNTVIITHHLPHALSVADRFKRDPMSAAFASNLPDVEGSGASLWIHGHTHDSFDYELGGVRVICNPRGYQRKSDPEPENKNFVPDLVVSI